MRTGISALSAAISARQLRLAERRTGRHQHQKLIEVAGERLGLPLVLAEQQVAARLDMFDDAFIAADLPADPIADDAIALLAARMAGDAAPFRCLDHVVPAVARDDEADVELDGGAHGRAPASRARIFSVGPYATKDTRASAFAAQMKSLREMPSTEWVENRVTQRLYETARSGWWSSVLQIQARAFTNAIVS